MQTDQVLALARSVLQEEGQAVAALADKIDERFAVAAQKLLDCRGHVLVAGAGTSHAVGARLAHLLSCCGTPALFLHPGDTQHGQAGAVTDRDVLLVISKGGETAEVNHLAQVARARGAALIAFCENPSSTLGGLCDVVLPAQAPAAVDS